MSLIGSKFGHISYALNSPSYWIIISPDYPDTIITPAKDLCVSKYTNLWVAILTSSNGLLIILAAFLAYETRQVKVQGLNDSKYIAICMYNLVLLSGIAVPVAFALQLHQDYPYLAIASLIIYCTSLSLCLFFIIRFRIICKYPVEERPIKVLKKDTSLILSTQCECQCSYTQSEGKLITALTVKLQEEFASNRDKLKITITKYQLWNIMIDKQ
ncbi:uncharacterized protein TRIADDRAFT_51954 [Trichoplax adhaerens]|uniref:G-protein coupled receptors family 3 profile domain-containing protein n=1 Tax=Trichoplax adhaerens TaxID=10228 RepID=B3RLC1_TRIAD|nr:hypothetical protein TRIADDRAFT_51954 [Trichoplax adhaerens]EDV28741.1 hypothetical protein TRIADDRAFT_51954 [Trichoplax adhaerens]|eukprot:XP_002107943.1 hypothetical protein TRIADDRAFT_51954 [Trichoplax adhaerens]